MWVTTATTGNPLPECPASLVGLALPHHAQLLDASPARLIHAGTSGKPLLECLGVARPSVFVSVCRQALVGLSAMGTRGFAHDGEVSPHLLVDDDAAVMLVGHSFAPRADGGDAERAAVRTLARTLCDVWNRVALARPRARATGGAAALRLCLEAGARGAFSDTASMEAALPAETFGGRRQTGALGVESCRASEAG